MLARLTFHHKLSAFKVYVWWSLIRVSVLFTLFVTQWDHYSDAYWASRLITIAFTANLIYELLATKHTQTILGVLGLGFGACIAMLQCFDSEWLLRADRLFGLAICAACVLRLVWPAKSGANYSKFIPIGLLVLTLFPAIAETPAVLQYGGWLRYIPTLSAVIAQVVWIYGYTHKKEVLPVWSGKRRRRLLHRSAL